MKIYQFSESTKSIGKGRQYHFTNNMTSLRIPAQSCEGFEGACGIGSHNSLSRLRIEVPHDPSFQKKWRKSSYRVPREIFLRIKTLQVILRIKGVTCYLIQIIRSGF